MAIELLNSDERDRLIDTDGGGCGCCGFMEEGLIAFRDIDGKDKLSCRECFDQQEDGSRPGLVYAYLPEMPSPAFSHYVRALAFITFAGRAAAIDGHDFSEGTLPPRFRMADGWAAPIRWKTLAEGLANAEPHTQLAEDLNAAKRSFDFLKSRIEYVEAGQRGSPRTHSDPNGGTPRPEYRAMAPEIGLDRIRSWGKPGSSFRIAGRR